MIKATLKNGREFVFPEANYAMRDCFHNCGGERLNKVIKLYVHSDGKLVAWVPQDGSVVDFRGVEPKPQPSMLRLSAKGKPTRRFTHQIKLPAKRKTTNKKDK